MNEDLSNFKLLSDMPVEKLEERIGEQLLAGSHGMKPPDATTKRSAARNWWRSQVEVLRKVVCESTILRKYLFSNSEKDRNLAIAIISDAITGPFIGIPAASLLALTCHYGTDKLCGEQAQG